jgi:CRAL/TRIO domain
VSWCAERVPRVQQKQPHFFTMKKAFPHCCLGISKDGHAVFAMKMGALEENYSQITEAGLSNDQIVQHLCLVYEYFFQKIDPDPLPGGQLINIMDFEGMGIMDMKGLQRRRCRAGVCLMVTVSCRDLVLSERVSNHCSAASTLVFLQHSLG